MMDFICRFISCLISFLPFKFLNDLVMFLYKIYCRRQHRSVQESLNYIVRKQGFYLETYEVQTNDGYILILHRIKRKTSQKSNKELLPVFLQHGLLCSSADFLLQDGMAYTFANSGRDVWLGNFRGNIFSRRYPCPRQDVVEQRINNRNYWSFSFDEHGKIQIKLLYHA